MVCYCCVKGCNNSKNNSKKNCGITFHAFPSNPEYKRKWLRAIGRPNWDPPNHVRICSAHFSDDKLNQDGYRTRIKDDACPVKALPPNANFEASFIEMCRICLATDTRMFSFENEVLKMQFEAIAGFEKQTIEGLPQFICYMCKAILSKFYKLIEKSMIAQATLMNIFSENGVITKSLAMQQDRESLNLISSLRSHSITPTHLFEYAYSDETYTSNLKESCRSMDIVTITSDEKKIPTTVANYKTEDNEIGTNIKEDTNVTNCNDNAIESVYLFCEDNSDNVASDHDKADDSKSNNTKLPENLLKNIEGIQRNDDEHCGNISHDNNDLYQTHEVSKKNSNRNSFAPSKFSMEKYFDIVILTQEEQIEKWKKFIEKPKFNDGTVYRCEVCSKAYASMNTLNNHSVCHNITCGEYECLVCKQRFKSPDQVRVHGNRLHRKLFKCKSCSKTFGNESVAKKHHRWHSGHVYRCPLCAFSSAHASALGAHARAKHACRACALCGHNFLNEKGLKLHKATAHRGEQDNEATNAYSCDECKISFRTDGARRVHILVSKHHKEKTDDGKTTHRDSSLKTTCKWCGGVFATVGELTLHARAQHRRPAKKTSWSLPGDSYPTKCDYCSEVVGSRGQHWAHVRRSHPAQRAAYRPVVTAVCHACGRGFQNATKLRQHLCRAACPRVPRDQASRARHRARPHACPLCPRAFKLRAHLTRHAAVHSGATPYECMLCDKKFKYSTSVALHVRTVHYQLPHPLRKRRPRDKPVDAEAE